MNRTLITCLALAAISGTAFAQGTQKPSHPAGKPTPSPTAKPAAEQPAGGEMDAMMKEMMAKNQPGPNHELLKQFVGNWDVTCKFWMDPNAPAMECKGTQKDTIVMDGRFVKSAYQSPDMMGMPFNGVGFVGYDVNREQFVSIWMDSMSTGVMMGYGDYDTESKTFTFHYDTLDCMTGEPCKFRNVQKIIDNDHYVFEMYRTGQDGKEFKNGEMHYSRIDRGAAEAGEIKAAPASKK